MSIRKLLAGLMVGMLFISSLAMAGGGTWKMGPFGPYWDDNSWPEFTPMYWMEEFLNGLNDDDAEIQQWMMRNQYAGAYPGQYPVPAGNNAYWPGSVAAVPPGYGWAANPAAAPNQLPVPAPAGVPPGANTPDTIPGQVFNQRPGMVAPAPVSPPVQPQMNAYPSGPSRDGRQPTSAYSEFDRLPNLTPQEFSSMPPQLQQQYEQAFNQAFANYQRRKQMEQALQNRPPASPSRRNRDTRRSYTSPSYVRPGDRSPGYFPRGYVPPAPAPSQGRTPYR